MNLAQLLNRRWVVSFLLLLLILVCYESNTVTFITSACFGLMSLFELVKQPKLITQWHIAFLYLIMFTSNGLGVWLSTYYLIYQPTNSKEFSTPLCDVYLINSGSDIFQYLGGKLIGKHLFAPSISPKKTWEGYIVGLFGGLFLGLKVAKGNYDVTTLIMLIISGYIGGIISSMLKRFYKIDNWSNYLGSHGGFADRTDSLAFSLAFFILSGF